MWLHAEQHKHREAVNNIYLAQAAVITFGFPLLSYVPTTKTGFGKTMVLAPIEIFMYPPKLMHIVKIYSQ